MNHSRQDELLQGRLDGPLDAGDASELQAALDSSDEVRARAADFDRLAALLADARNETADADVARDVMARISPKVVTITSHRMVQGMGGGRMSKKILWGLAAAAAIVLGVFAIEGFPPVDGTQGTIGAAKRYNGGQLGDQDVQVGDVAAQDFLQSDTFAAIVQDRGRREAPVGPRPAGRAPEPGPRTGPQPTRRSSKPSPIPAVGRALRDPALGKALGDPVVRQALSNPALGRALSDDALAKALTDSNLRAP